MKTRKGRMIGLTLALLVTLLMVVGIVMADDPARGLAQRQRFNWIVTKRLTVQNHTQLNGTVAVAGAVTFGGDFTIEEDLTVEGDTDLQGALANSTGDLDIRDNITVSGDVDIVGGLVVTGTSDLQGDVSDSGGDFTIADNTFIDGQENAVQLIIQGNATEQNLDLIVAEDSDGTDVFSVGATGNIFISGTLDVRGAVSDGDSDLWINDSITVTGDVDISGALVVTETSDLRGDVSDGVGDFTIADNLAVTGATDLQGALSDSTSDLSITDNVTVTGDVDVTANLVVSQSIGLHTWLWADPVVTLDITSTLSITPTGTYQPLTVDGVGAVTTGNPSIVDGPYVGAMLILINEDDQDIIITDNQNTKSGGNITLTANNDDSVIYIWDGSDWICLAFHDN